MYLAGSIVATIDHDWPSNAVIATKYQHTDALGSPVAVTNAAGAVIDRNDYEPYGAIIGKPTYSGIGYTGHVLDGATGLTYMQQRYYDQSVGRFLSVDPVTADAKVGANFNRYWYANNNPYKFVDPDGRQVYMEKMSAYMHHYYRNVSNNPPQTLNEAKANKNWRKLSPLQSAFHTRGPYGLPFTENNTKWVDASGHQEAVYDENGKLITDTINGGTYNYASPDNAADHFRLDVFPYFLWGNGPIEVSAPGVNVTITIGEIEVTTRQENVPTKENETPPEPQPPKKKVN